MLTETMLGLISFKNTEFNNKLRNFNGIKNYATIIEEFASKKSCIIRVKFPKF